MRNALGGVTSAVTTGYRPAQLKQAAPYVVGAVINPITTSLIQKLPVSFLKSGIGKVIAGLGAAGITGFGAGFVNKSYRMPVTLGAMTQVLASFVVDFLPALGLKGLGDYLTVADARDARALGDYLTVSDARNARALGYMGQQVNEEPIMQYTLTQGYPSIQDPQLGRIACDAAIAATDAAELSDMM